MSMKPELRRAYEAAQGDAFARYLGYAKARMTPLKAEKPDEELYSYRAPGSERPFLLKRLASGHWLIRPGYTDESDPEPWKRVRSERAREVLKAARAEVFCGRR